MLPHDIQQEVHVSYRAADTRDISRSAAASE